MKNKKRVTSYSANGFEVQINGQGDRAEAVFESFNNKVTYCYLSTRFGTFIGKCKMQEGDTFNELEGQRKALRYAIRKYNEAINQYANEIREEVERMITDIEAVPRRLEKVAKRKAIKESKKAQKLVARTVQQIAEK